MMEDLINTITTNLGIAYTDLILLLTILSSLIFFAKSFRIGALVLFVLCAGEFVAFYLAGLETFKALIATLVALVLLSMSLFLSQAHRQVIV